MQTYLPTSLDEALDALDATPDATVLAGGTDLMVGVTYHGVRPSSVVAIRRVEEIKEWDDRHIGAGVTYTRMEHGPIVALAQAARTVGSPQIRNAGTLGGNLATASPAGDTLPVLAALDAEIVVRSKDGERTLPWNQFFTGPKRSALQPSELVIGARLPGHMPEHQGFAKIGIRNAMVIAIASCCVMRWDDGRVAVGLGSVGPTPLRAPRAEALVSGAERPDAALLDEFQRTVSEESRPITDHRSTEAYRRQAVGVLARRLLERTFA